MAPSIYTGRFDPKFLGVAIRAKRYSEVQSFRLNVRDSQPQTSILAALSDEAVVSDVSRQTVLEHEVRHFHDALLYPFGHMAIRSRFSASYNGFYVGINLIGLKGAANALVVPLQRWLLMPEPEREEFLTHMHHLTGRDLRAPMLPVLSRDDDLSRLDLRPGGMPKDQESLITGCRVTLADYRRVEDLWRSPHREGDEIVAPTIDFWEVSGLICQFAAIEQITNSKVMSRFIDWMQNHGPQAYVRGLKILNWCLDQINWPPTIRNYLALVSWAQMGAFKTEMGQSTPGDRLVRIVAAAKQGKRWSIDSRFIDLVRNWDDVIGTDSIATLMGASDDLKRFAADTVRQYGPRLLSPTPTVFTGLSSAHQLMLTAFLDDPDGYVDPVSYLARWSVYPMPCVGVTYPLGPDYGTEWIDATPAEWYPAIEYDATLGLVAMAELADALFLPGEKSLQISGRSVVRKQLDLEAIRIIQ
jgi:hypothetical protein